MKRQTIAFALVLGLALVMGLSGCAGGVFRLSEPIDSVKQTEDIGDRYLALDREIRCYEASGSEIDLGKIKAEIHPLMYRAGGTYEELAVLNIKYGIDAKANSGRTSKPAEVLGKEADLAAELEEIEGRLIYFRTKYPACREQARAQGKE